ncbi:MAG: ribonuclease Z [Gaiellales bacterium]
MGLDVVFIGTSGSIPTARRAAPAVLLRRGGDRFLIDCGEGTQRQLQRSLIGLIDLEHILITHFHADHFLGLPGMLKTFALRGRDAPLTVYGPSGLRHLFDSLHRIFGKLTYDLSLVELHDADAIERDEYSIAAFDVDHGTSALGYALVERDRPGRFDVEAARALGVPEGPKWGALQRGEEVVSADGAAVSPAMVLGQARAGRTVVITGDTRPARRVLDIANTADLLVHDGGFGRDEQERALETGHSTAAAAAEVARLSGVQMLALTHISPRYLGAELEQEARETFTNTVVPRDYDVVEVPLPERGGPRLVEGGASQRGSRRTAGDAAALVGSARSGS